MPDLLSGLDLVIGSIDLTYTVCGGSATWPGLGKVKSRGVACEAQCAPGNFIISRNPV